MFAFVKFEEARDVKRKNRERCVVRDMASETGTVNAWDLVEKPWMEACRLAAACQLMTWLALSHRAADACRHTATSFAALLEGSSAGTNTR